VTAGDRVSPDICRMMLKFLSKSTLPVTEPHIGEFTNMEAWKEQLRGPKTNEAAVAAECMRARMQLAVQPFASDEFESTSQDEDGVPNCEVSKVI